jgi:molybdopterin converting factor small subunit
VATYTVEMFGLPYSISGIREIKIELEDKMKLTDIIGALRREIPALEGEVITPGNDYLMDGFTFNINGRFYVDDRDLILKEGDHIILLTLATIG